VWKAIRKDLTRKCRSTWHSCSLGLLTLVGKLWKAIEKIAHRCWRSLGSSMYGTLSASIILCQILDLPLRT
jgi:hypothetical protein